MLMRSNPNSNNKHNIITRYRLIWKLFETSTANDSSRISAAPHMYGVILLRVNFFFPDTQ